MAEPDDLQALVAYLPPPNDEILSRAAVYLDRYREQGDRYALETASNLVTDVVGNLRCNRLAVPELLHRYDHELRSERVAEFASVGRQPDMTPPYWKRGW